MSKGIDVTTIIMLFILPLGIIFFLFDKRLQKQNQEIFHTYVEKIKQSDLSQKEKIDKIDNMYYQNGYTRVSKTDTTLTVEKKHLNLGVILIFFGILNYFGLFIFFIYYKFIQKAKRIETVI